MASLTSLLYARHRAICAVCAGSAPLPSVEDGQTAVQATADGPPAAGRPPEPASDHRAGR